MNGGFCVFGLGSVGMLLSLFLHKGSNKPVIGVVRRWEQARAIAEARGVRVRGLVEGFAPVIPIVFSDDPRVRCKFAIVATKAYDAPRAVGAAVRVASEGVLVAGNGFGGLEEAYKHGAEAAGIVVEYGVTRLNDVEAEVRGLGRLVLGGYRGRGVNVARAVGEILQRGGARVSIVEDVEPWRWLKASINASLNPLAALLGRAKGVVLEEGEAWGVASRAAREVGLIAKALGINLPEDPVEALKRVADATRGNISSTLQDLRSCRKTEVEEINGYIVRAAGRASVSAPTVETLYLLLKSLERVVLESCGGSSRPGT